MRRATALLVLVAASAAAAPAGGATEPRPRIVGGTPAGERAHPAQVRLEVRLVPGVPALCGGTLVAQDKVVTAAHCLDRQSLPALVGVGTPVALTGGVPVDPADVTVFTGSNRQSGGTPRQVARVELHPQWDASTERHDVAVLTLAGPVAATDVPLPITDPAGDAGTFEPGAPATVVGWGTTAEEGETSELLQEVTVPIVSQADCNDADSYDGAIDEALMLCAGLEAGGKDSCQGDSGGPLMTRADGVLKLTGVVSFGAGCGRAELPGVYAKVPGPLRGFLVERAGAPPAVAIEAPAAPAAGAPIALRAAATDADGVVASIAWDLDGDGEFDDATGERATVPALAAGASRTVRVLVRDDRRMAGTDERTVVAVRPAAGGTGAGTPAGRPEPAPGRDAPAPGPGPAGSAGSGSGAPAAPAPQGGTPGSPRAAVPLLRAVVGPQARSAVRRRGLALRASCAAPCRLRVVVRVAGRAVAVRELTLRGSRALRVALTPAGRRLLARPGARRATVELTARTAGGRRATVRRAVLLR